MRNRSAWALSALVGTLLIPGIARAQIGGLGGYQQKDPEDTSRRGYQIKRKSVSGVIKSVDGEKKAVVLEVGSGGSKKEMPIDMSAGLIKAGRGSATVADLKVGDRLAVYGETDVHGGLRAMETQAPAARMSVAPPTKEQRRAQREKEKAAEREARAKEKADREAEKMAKADSAKSDTSKADKPAKKAKKAKHDKDAKKGDDAAQPDSSAQPTPAGDKQ